MHGEISGRTASGDVHPVGALNKTLISDTAVLYVLRTLSTEPVVFQPWQILLSSTGKWGIDAGLQVTYSMTSEPFY